MKGLKSVTVASKKPAAELLKAKAEPKKTMKHEKVEKGSKKKDGDRDVMNRMEEFRKSFKLEFPDVKSGPAVGKAGGEKWKSLSATMTLLAVIISLLLIPIVGAAAPPTQEKMVDAQASKLFAEAEKIRQDADLVREEVVSLREIRENTLFCAVIVVGGIAAVGFLFWLCSWASLIGDYLCSNLCLGNLKTKRELEKIDLIMLKEMNEAFKEDEVFRQKMDTELSTWRAARGNPTPPNPPRRTRPQP